jgi:hypothetical protein
LWEFPCRTFKPKILPGCHIISQYLPKKFGQRSLDKSDEVLYNSNIKAKGWCQAIPKDFRLLQDGTPKKEIFQNRPW